MLSPHSPPSGASPISGSSPSKNERPPCIPTTSAAEPTTSRQRRHSSARRNPQADGDDARAGRFRHALADGAKRGEKRIAYGSQQIDGGAQRPVGPPQIDDHGQSDGCHERRDSRDKWVSVVLFLRHRGQHTPEAREREEGWCAVTDRSGEEGSCRRNARGAWIPVSGHGNDGARGRGFPCQGTGMTGGGHGNDGWRTRE